MYADGRLYHSLESGVPSLKKLMNTPLTLSECGVLQKRIDQYVHYVAQNAVQDGCTPMNPWE